MESTAQHGHSSTNHNTQLSIAKENGRFKVAISNLHSAKERMVHISMMSIGFDGNRSLTECKIEIATLNRPFSFAIGS